MANSVTQIANLALTELGADLITSLTDNVKSAILINANWELVRDAVLRAYPWNCAVARREMAPEAATPIDEWSYQFLLPSECLRVLSSDLDKDQFVIEGRRLLANTDTIKIKYIKKITDVTQYDAMLVHALATRLAYVLAYPLLQSSTMKDMMWEAYRLTVKEARSVDAQEGMQPELEDGSWLDSRV